MSSNQSKTQSSLTSGVQLALVPVVFLFALALGYLAGIRQTNTTAGGPPKILTLNLFGKALHVQLSVGALGIAVILILTVLLAIACVLTIVASRQRRKAQRANRELEREIGEHRQTERALRESDTRTRAIVETAFDAIITMDHAGEIVEFNPASEKIFGYSRSDVMGRPLAEVIIPPALRGRHSDGLARYLATGEAAVLGKRIEMTGLRADGSLVDVELSINQVPGAGRPMFTGFLRDITERKRTEAARALLARIVELSGDAIISKNLDGIVTSWNAGAEKIFGYSAEEMIDKPIGILIPQEARDEEADILARIRRGESVDHYETARIHKEGHHVQVSMTVSPMKSAGGEIVGVSKTARDITDRKRAEQRLHTQLERMALLDQITRAIAERQDLQSIFQVVIRTLEDQLPIDFGCVCLYDPVAQELIVTCIGVHSAALAVELAMPEQAHIGIDQNGLGRCARGQLVYEPDIAHSEFSFTRRLAKGGLCSLVAAPLVSESRVFGAIITARRQPNAFSSGDCEFLRQLSEHVALAAYQMQTQSALQQAYDDLRQTQQVVMQQERLRALGQMASGIAHDINNALSPVALYTESLLEREPNLSARTRDYLEITQRAIEDVAHTVARMREFYRTRETQLTLAAVNVNQLVQQVLDLTRPRWSDMLQQRGIVIYLRSELGPDLPTVAGNESEIREALVNLIFNAVDAMPEGGRLTVRTGAERGSTSAPLQHVYVEVEDTGVGMDEETRRRCLEPFFTTKGERGSGLGLAMVFGVVQRHDAEIGIESAVGKGTTVRLSFPITAQTLQTAQPHRSRVLERLRILVVDDDPLIIASLRDTLEADGHTVITANGGQQGIEIFQAEGGQQFDVVITDLGMPRIDGRRVATAVKATRPETPVILLTGWGQRLVAEGDTPPHVDRVLNKPAKLQELRKALAELRRNPDPHGSV